VLRHLHSLRVIRSRMHACCGVFGGQPQLLTALAAVCGAAPWAGCLQCPQRGRRRCAIPPPPCSRLLARYTGARLLRCAAGSAVECSRRRPNTARTTYGPRRPVRRPDVRVSVSAGVMSAATWPCNRDSAAWVEGSSCPPIQCLALRSASPQRWQGCIVCRSCSQAKAVCQATRIASARNTRYAWCATLASAAVSCRAVCPVRCRV